MGLLDEAIREHLELKRRRGADPGEIALQERAALDPVYQAADAAGEGPEPVEPPTDTHAIATEAAGGEAPSEEASDVDLREDAAVEAEVDRWLDAPVPTAQETAELDMEAVLAAEDEHDGPQGDPLGSEALSRGAADWDFPTEPAEDAPPEPIPGQERMPFE